SHGQSASASYSRSRPAKPICAASSAMVRADSRARRAIARADSDRPLDVLVPPAFIALAPARHLLIAELVDRRWGLAPGQSHVSSPPPRARAGQRLAVGAGCH